MEVSNLSDAISMATGGGHSCALRSGGSVVCWGRNYDGELGIGSLDEYKATPVAVPGVTGIALVGCGGALRSDGTTACWGTNYANQFGIGDPWSTIPSSVVWFG